MKTSYVVGPKGCGKTLNERLIASFLGCDAHGDIGTPFLAGYNAQHALALTSEVPRTLYEGDSVFHFFHLRDLILRDPIFCDQWQDADPAGSAQSSEHACDCVLLDFSNLEQALQLEGDTLSDFFDRLGATSDAVIEVAEPEFKLGAVACLKSGGPAMTVTDRAFPDNRVECMWASPGGMRTDVFDKALLTEVLAANALSGGVL